MVMSSFSWYQIMGLTSNIFEGLQDVKINDALLQPMDVIVVRAAVHEVRVGRAQVASRRDDDARALVHLLALAAVRALLVAVLLQLVRPVSQPDEGPQFARLKRRVERIVVLVREL